EAGLDNGNVDLAVREVLERNSSQHVKICRSWLNSRNERLDELNEPGERRLGGHFPIDDDSFAHIDEMRASIEAGLIAVGLEHCGDHRASASLGFGSGNVHGAELILWAAEPFEEVPHSLEVEILGVVADNPEALEIAEGRKKSQSFVVSGVRFM